MRKIVLPLVLSFAALALSQKAEARLKIPFGEKDVIEKVAELPDTQEYALDESGKKHIDLGRMHTEYNIAWIMPLYIVKEPKLVGVVPGEKDTYYELSDEEINNIVAANNLKKEELLQIGFYTKYGGKVVAGLLILLILWGLFSKNKKDVKPETV